MPYTTADARQQLLDTIAEAADRLGAAVSSLSEAYERLDEHSYIVPGLGDAGDRQFYTG